MTTCDLICCCFYCYYYYYHGATTFDPPGFLSAATNFYRHDLSSNATNSVRTVSFSGGAVTFGQPAISFAATNSGR